MTARFLYSAVIVSASVVIPIAVAAYRYKKLGTPHKVIFYYLIFAGIIGGTGVYYAAHRMNNLWLLHTYTAYETVVLLWFYRTVIDNARTRRVIPYLMVLFPLVCAANIVWWQSLLRHNTYTRPVEALLLIYLGLVYFLERSQSDRQPQASLAWINAGLLLYFSASFFIFIFANYLHPDQFFNTFIQVTHATFVLFMYILFTMGFLKCSK